MSKQNPDKMVIKLIHGSKKKLRLWDKNISYANAINDVMNTFPSIKRNNVSIFHLEYDNSTWIEDNNDWEIYLDYYNNVSQNGSHKLKKELYLYVVMGNDTVGQTLIKHDTKDNNDEEINPPKAKKQKLNDDNDTKTNNDSRNNTEMDVNIHLNERIQIPSKTVKKYDNYISKCDTLWECIKIILMNEYKRGMKTGISVSSLIEKLSQYNDNISINEVNSVLYTQIGNGNVTKFHSDIKLKPLWSLNLE
mmetsp:Transcript_51488/g.62979  ORF Transcript_51488/g.62979 Transcript_51488/m.62979 type:complete len:249 (+) Transcript_51488:21-767(+)